MAKETKTTGDKKRASTKSVSPKAVKPSTKAKRKAKPKKPLGPPIKFKKEYYDMFITFGQHGYTDKQICKKIGIVLSTFYEWKLKYPGLSDALKQGKDSWDDAVEQALRKSAEGFEHEDLFITQSNGKIIKEEIRKRYPPNTAAAIFWLKNRRPEKWRDKQNIDVTSNGQTIMNINTPTGTVEKVDDK